MPESETMNVYDIAPDNTGRVHVYILVPGVDTLIGLPLDKALAFAGDLQAEIGRYSLPDRAQSPPLSIQARKALNFAHRRMELDGYPPTTEEIADYIGTSRRSLVRGVLKELESKGWYRHGLGHRDGSWGGSYKRPLRPPFLSLPKEEVNLGQLQLAI